MESKINVTKTLLPKFEDYSLALKEIWNSKFLTNRSHNVLKLEDEVKRYLSCESRPLLVCNGTIALQFAIKALGLSGEIITTPFSYIATSSSILWEGCKPVFVDINPEFLTIDEDKIEEKINSNTSAILATHVYGNPCKVDVIEKISKKYNLKIIYDASHCFGVKYMGKSIFDYGDLSTCSFHATKIFHTAEGGAVFCKDSEILKKIFNLHNFGHNGPEHFYGLGINGKMSELHAALGLTLLPYIDNSIEKRRKIINQYNNQLNFSKFKNLSIRSGTTWNCSYYPIVASSEKLLEKVLSNLNTKNIYPRRYFYPSLDSLDFFQSESYCSYSRDISKRILCLPIYDELNSLEINKICRTINNSI